MVRLVSIVTVLVCSVLISHVSGAGNSLFSVRGTSTVATAVSDIESNLLLLNRSVVQMLREAQPAEISSLVDCTEHETIDCGHSCSLHSNLSGGVTVIVGASKDLCKAPMTQVELKGVADLKHLRPPKLLT